eukprot:TRINITY_DN85825_c0_g1_i1.p1 TRINITY_DN85825_c0_g1~~TRINITY_DN85825_c0_g1_i1.p1  ORF type:complete len:176 (+),score=20.63 TRINITY_DN85825_c0_g1_i1:43-528(+)
MAKVLARLLCCLLSFHVSKVSCGGAGHQRFLAGQADAADSKEAPDKMADAPEAAASNQTTSEQVPIPSFPCDIFSITTLAEKWTLSNCSPDSDCYARTRIDRCAGHGTQCCAPEITTCEPGALCFATTAITTCMPWATCCAPTIRTCLSPSCSENFPACTM